MESVRVSNRKCLCVSSVVVLAVAAMLAAASCEPHEEMKPEKEAVLTPTEGQFSITTVYDNYQVNPALTTAWGFGCVIRTAQEGILFDTGGDSSILLGNMEKMGISPEDIDIVVISHIHGDHVGGLDGFLERNGKVEVYIPASFPDSLREKIKSRGAEYRDVTGCIKICDGVYTTGEMGSSIREQSLVLNTGEGLVVITGCAHPGIVSIVEKARRVLPDRSIYLVMGGFHLSGASDSQLKGIIEGFRGLGVQKVAPSHCSGDRCRELFRQEYGEDYVEGGAGNTISF